MAHWLRTELVAEDLRVGYGSFLALQVEKLSITGNTIAIVGHNGAGKSTFIKAVLGVLPVRFGLLQLRALNSGKRVLAAQEDMAFCPENGAVFADITVEQYLKFWCRIKHNDSRYYRKAGARYIDLLDLAALLPKLGRELSKGQRRRVQTAIGFLINPALFLFDEPFDGLDVKRSSELTDIILAHNQKMSFMVSSHRMDIVERISDAVIVLKEGCVVSSGSLEQVCRDLCPQSVHIDGLQRQEQTVAALRQNFADVLISRIGTRVAVSAKRLDCDQIKKLVFAINGDGTSLTFKTPSLVDALNYHLHQF